MKICFAAHASNLTGASKSMLNLISELKKKNIEIYVILPKKGIIEEKLSEMNIQYTVVRSYSRMDKIGAKKNVLKDIIKVIINYFSMIKIEHILKKESIDLVHINSLIHYVAAKSAKKCNIPYIWHIREFLEEDHGVELSNKKEIEKLMKNAKAKIAISQSIYEKFEKIYGKDNMFMVYNGIPVEEYKSYTFIPVNFEKEVNLCIIGRISRGKGQLDAIKAIEILKNKDKNRKYRLYIIGSPEDDIEYDQEIKKYVKDNNLENIVNFVPFTTQLSEYRKKCRIALVCSKKEAFGRVTIEAMLANQLVIASNTGGNIELIQDKETGILYDETNYKDLAQKIEESVVNEDKVNSIIKNANKNSKEHFSIENTANKVFSIYKRL